RASCPQTSRRDAISGGSRMGLCRAASATTTPNGTVFRLTIARACATHVRPSVSWHRTCCPQADDCRANYEQRIALAASLRAVARGTASLPRSVTRRPKFEETALAIEVPGSAGRVSHGGSRLNDDDIY